MPRLTWIENALVQPCSGLGRRPAFNIDGGVYDGDGRLVEPARHLAEGSLQRAPATLARPDLPVTAGRWLFGGWLQHHFGHLLVFCLGRLWALQQLQEDLDGVVFLALPEGPPGRPMGNPMTAPHVRDILGCLGIGSKLPGECLAAPQRFERLAVPQHIIIGRSKAAPDDAAAFLHMMRRMCGSPLVGDGLVVPKLYVSRSRLGGRKGGLVLEDVLEENLAAEGYAILYPERLTVPEQLGIYAGAQRLVFAEGSALHLAVAALRPDRPVAIVARRPPVPAGWSYLQAAGMQQVTIVQAIRGGIAFTEDGQVTPLARFTALAVLDIAAARDQLVLAGLCSGKGWRIPAEDEVQARIAEAIAEHKAAWPRRTVTYLSAEAYLRAIAAPKPRPPRTIGRVS